MPSQNLPSTSRAPWRRFPAWAARWLLAVAGIGLLVALLLGVGAWARERALRDLESQARAAAQLSLAALSHKLDKFHAIPRVLAQDTALAAVLASPTPKALDGLSRRLEALAASWGPPSCMCSMRRAGRWRPATGVSRIPSSAMIIVSGRISRMPWMPATACTSPSGW